MSRAKGDSQLFSNIAASTSDFTLTGGKYGLTANATFGGGSVKLQKKLPDASGYVSVAAATDFTAAGYQTIDLPAGTYRLTIAMATAVYAEIVRIVGE
jgi:hypothetical protein